MVENGCMIAVVMKQIDSLNLKSLHTNLVSILKINWEILFNLFPSFKLIYCLVHLQHPLKYMIFIVTFKFKTSSYN